ncbi:Variant surface glycoprotein [Trypanosoma congolense IL3000]|uniref:Variant surface glycoprotein n=1 Tax=Trypanosoma congolense (strain IL3000) TaxID=1068625 RepID=F9W7C0_TRYCI|nr:Variant surface glycoprotein [Trypanosoma congolense IL3000]
MMRMKIWMVMCFVVLCVVNTKEADASGNKDYNKDAHKALCDVLNAAVRKWEDVKHSESPMKEALRKIIFGKSGGNTDVPSGLQFPNDYNSANENERKNPNSRKNWCGACGGEEQKHYPGESAPHDLVCLCTPGEKGWPIKSQNGEKLCGKTRHTWGSDVSNKGWYTAWSDHDQEREYLNKTWSEIVTKCLNTEDRIDLDTALRTFMEEITRQNEHRLGEGTYDCDGKTGVGACVLYTPQCKKKTWWTELEKALQKEKDELEKQKLSGDKEQKLSSSKGLQTTPQKSTQNPQPTQRDSQSPQTDNSDDPPRAEQVISNINATIEEDSSTIILPFWLLLVFLYN